MAICKSCGTENKDGAKFCENCGSPLQEPKNEKGSFCPKCGTKISDGSAFCPACGYKVGDVIVNQPVYAYPGQTAGPVQQEKVSLIRSLLVTIGMFAFIGLVVLALMMPVTKGGTDNIAESVKSMIETFKNFSSSSAGALPIILMQAFCTFFAVGGVIGFGIAGVISGIQAIIKKSVPKYGLVGSIIGFVLPYYIFTVGGAIALDNASTPGTGFTGLSTAFMESQSLLIFLIAVLVYIGFGLFNSFAGNIENKKGVGGSIVKTIAAVFAFAMIVLPFMLTITYMGSGNSFETYNIMISYITVGIYLGLGGELNNPVVLMRLIATLVIFLGPIFSGLAFGDLFGKNKKGSKSTPFVVWIIIFIVFIAVTAFESMNSSGGGGSSTPTIPFLSMTGCLLLASGILYIIFGGISSKKDKEI